MNLRLTGKLKLRDNQDYFSLLFVKVNGANLDLSNLAECERDDLMDVSMNLSLNNGAEAWSTSLTLDFFDKNAAEIKMPVVKYIDLTIKALVNAIDGKYIYEIVKTDDSQAQFLWKEKMTNDEITIKLGSCDLLPEDITKTTCSMLSFSFGKVGELEKQMKASESEIISLSADREQAVKKLEKFVNEKNTMEKDLYAKFVTVLNEKKMKIGELQEMLRENNRDAETTQEKMEEDETRISKRPATKKCLKVKVVAGMSLGKPENDSGSDTDVEMPPKTSKDDHKCTSDDNLLLDDSQNESFSFAPRRKKKK